MSQKFIRYIIETDLLDETEFAPLCQSLMLNYPHCQPIRRVGSNLIIRIDLDGWDHYMDEYFERYREKKIIGRWTMRRE